MYTRFPVAAEIQPVFPIAYKDVRMPLGWWKAGEEHTYNCLEVPASYLLPLIQTLTLASALTCRVSRRRYPAKWGGLTSYKILIQKNKSSFLASIIPSVKCMFIRGAMIPVVEFMLLSMFQKKLVAL